ncbi:hypothetical protein IAU60_001558 [Kwoniella sp. DSM 27419]
MLVHSTPPLQPRIIHLPVYTPSPGHDPLRPSQPPPFHHRPSPLASFATPHASIQPLLSPEPQRAVPRGPPPSHRRTSSLRDPPPGASRSPSAAAATQEEDESMALQAKQAKKKGRKKDERG